MSDQMFCPHCNPCMGNGNEKCRKPAPAAPAVRHPNTSRFHRAMAADCAAPAPDADELVQDLSDEADLCANEGADDIAQLLIEARERIEQQARALAVLRLAVKDDAQWAQENERLTRERDEWKVRAELAEDQREQTRDVWATRAEQAESKCSDMSVNIEKYRNEVAALQAQLHDYKENSAHFLKRAERAESALAERDKVIAAAEQQRDALAPNAQRYLAMKDDCDGLIETLVCEPYDTWDRIIDEHRAAARAQIGEKK